MKFRFIQIIVGMIVVSNALQGRPEDVMQWRYGVDVCKGKWAYARYALCQDTSLKPIKFTTETTKLEPDIFKQDYDEEIQDDISCEASHWESQRYCKAYETIVKVVNSWNEGSWIYPNTSPHPYTCPAGSALLYDHFINCQPYYDPFNPGRTYHICDVILECESQKTVSFPETTNMNGCPAEHQATRPNPDKPVEWSCEVPIAWESSRRQECGSEEELLFVDDEDLNWNDFASNRQVEQKNIVTEFYNFTSACATCDDLPVNTIAERRAKLACLKSAYFSGKNGSLEYSTRAFHEVIASIYKLLEQAQILDPMESSSEHTFSSSDMDFVNYDVSYDYPQVFFKHPTLFPEFVNANFNFQMGSRPLLDGNYLIIRDSLYNRPRLFNTRWLLSGDISDIVAANHHDIDSFTAVDDIIQGSHIEFTTNGGWEVRLVPGVYDITIAVSEFYGFLGSPSHVVYVEESPFLEFTANPFVTDPIQYHMVTKTIDLSDYFLTISATANTKISFVNIKRKRND